MLNGTAIVMSRVPLAILENFQQKGRFNQNSRSSPKVDGERSNKIVSKLAFDGKVIKLKICYGQN